MATLSQIRDALAAQLAARIPGLRTSSTWPGQINPPGAVVTRRVTTYGTAMASGADDYLLAVAVYVEQGQQDTLDGYLAAAGPTSIRAAVDADPTLGGLVDSAAVVRAERDQLVEYAGVQYLSAELVVEVL